MGNGDMGYEWILLLNAVFGLFIGPLVIFFRRPIGRFFFRFWGRRRDFLFPQWVERLRMRTEEEFINFYFNVGIFCIVFGVSFLILYFLL